MYAEFKVQVSVQTLQNVMHACHVEERYRDSTPKHAAGYCKKGEFSKALLEKDELLEFVKKGGYSVFFDNPHPTWNGDEFGKISSQGKRTDLHDAIDSIESGLPMRQVIRAHPEVAVKYSRGLNAVRWAFQASRRMDRMPDVYVFVGPTGTGKTATAYKEFDEQAERYVWNPQQGMWFDGYDGEDIIVFDEFRGQLPFAMILTICDRYGCRLQVKGGMVELKATKIIFTSCKHPHDWYNIFDDEEKYDQLQRRITKIVNFGVECSEVA